jgi:phosphinothricin acetyltransferase
MATGNATFETTPPSWEDWDANHRTDLRFVATLGDQIVGWVAAGDVSDRCCYAGVVEHSVYVCPDHQGRGIAKTLLNTLIDAAERAGVWTIQSGIFPENTASVALHHAVGFRTVGRRERLGQLNGAWRDVLLLERRRPEPDPKPGPTRRLIPLACTLEDAEADERIDQWRQALHGLVATVDRPQPQRLCLALAGQPGRVGALVEIAKAEKACCSFFDFTLYIGAEAVTLAIEVPAGSEDVLDNFARLATNT